MLQRGKHCKHAGWWPGNRSACGPLKRTDVLALTQQDVVCRLHDLLVILFCTAYNTTKHTHKGWRLEAESKGMSQSGHPTAASHHDTCRTLSHSKGRTRVYGWSDPYWCSALLLGPLLRQTPCRFVHVAHRQAAVECKQCVTHMLCA